MFRVGIVSANTEGELHGVPDGERGDHRADADGAPESPSDRELGDLDGSPDQGYGAPRSVGDPQHEPIQGPRPEVDPDIEIGPRPHEPHPEEQEQQLPDEARGRGDDPPTDEEVDE